MQIQQPAPPRYPKRSRPALMPRLRVLSRSAISVHRLSARDDSPPPLAARIIPRGASRREMASLETIMANLALDDQHPVALELVGDGQGVSLLLRAATAPALAHLVSQVQALYPQARIDVLSVDRDPLRLEVGEAYTVQELRLGAPSYLSLRTWDARAAERHDAEGSDPLLAILAALQQLPPGTRAVAQLALLPARPTWSAPYARKAVEHPLEPERTAQHNRHESHGPSMGLIGVLALVVALALVWRRFGTRLLPLIPGWVKTDIPELIRGHVPSLTPPELLQVALLLGLLLFGALIACRLVGQFQGKHPLYDMKQVGEKAKRVAYRTCLRLYVIGEGGTSGSEDSMTVTGGPESACEQNGVARVDLSERTGVEACPYESLPATHSGGLTIISPSDHHAPMEQAWQWWNQRWHNTRVRNKLRARVRRTHSEERQRIVTRLSASYRQYHQAWGNYLVPHSLHLRHAHLLASPTAPSVPSAPSASEGAVMPTFVRSCCRLAQWAWWGKASWHKDVARSQQYLSVAELASLWHLPPEQDIPDVPFLEHGGARTRLVPQVLTTAKPEEIEQEVGVVVRVRALLPYQMGTSTHAGQCWPVYVPRDLLRSNTLAVAATGKGKSTLFQHLSLAHLAAQQDDGLFFMEPHGDTIAALLGAIPTSRKEDVTLIDLADEATVVGINPLDMTQGIGRDKTVDNLLAVFVAFWQKQRSWGPRTENLLQFALLTLAEANQRRLDDLGEELGASGQYTLLDVIPLLQQAQYRSSILKELHDPVLLEWWTGYYNPMRQGFRDEVISPVINKISKYAAAHVSRRLLGQSTATIRLREDIAEGHTILINTASGVVGEEVSALAGATLVGLFQAALAEQVRLPRHARRHFLVFIDEFQTYLGIDYAMMLAELRKYGGTFGLATQSLSYLHEVDPSLKATVLSNIDHLFAFAMSAEDAKALAPYLDGLEIADVLSLDSFTCYARLTHEGVRLPTFSMQVAAPPMGNDDDAAWTRRHSAERHACPVGIVDEELAADRRVPLTPMPKEAEHVADAQLTSEEVAREPSAVLSAAASPAPSTKRERGERGKGGDASGTHRSNGSGSGGRADHPAVLSPRERVWYGENAERDERGEPGGSD